MWRIYHKLKQKIQRNKLASLICLSVCGYYFYKLLTKNRAKSVKLSYFLLALSQNAIEEIVTNSSLLLYFRGKGSQKWHQTDASILSKDKFYKLILKDQNIEVSCIKDPTNLDLQLVVPSIVLAGILAYFLTNKSIQNERYLSPIHYRTQIKLDDIIGMTEVKDQVQQVITFLKNRNSYGSSLHYEKQRILINGPQGTGKTLFAKAIAGQSQCTFIYVDASSFNNIFLGEGIKKIKELFDFAEQKSPCVIYINRLEDFGKDIINNREISYVQKEELKSMLNYLSNEISSINKRGKIIVVASTNNLLELQSRILDSIQFDIQLQTSMPNQEQRLQILQEQIKSYKNTVALQELNEVAKQTENFSGNDLQQLILESYIISNREGKNKIDQTSLMESLKGSKLQIKTFKA